jgi:2-desacetyl-2-hydroxyethyl bacteriochlorophyllide A dehydrogenase
MRAIVNAAPGTVELREVPMPEPRPGQVRVRTACCGICATDLEMIAGWQRTGFPSVPGHEWSGVVDAVGPSADASLRGKNCVAENVLSDGGEVGFEHPGGYGEFLLTEAANVRPLPDGFDMAAAVLIEPLAVCVHGLNRLELKDKQSALVIGDGPIGLLMVALLRDASVTRVACVGGRQPRLDLAAQLGATAVHNYHDVKHEASLNQAGPFATVIEASGSATGMTTALALAAPQAKILVIGDYGNRQDQVNWNTVLHKELTLTGSNASAGAWDEAVRLAVSGAVPLARLVSKRYAASAGLDAIQAVRTSRDVVKVVIDWRQLK